MMKNSKIIPPDIIGRWKCNNQIFWYRDDGIYTTIENIEFSISNNMLYLGSDEYHRVEGTKSIIGRWKIIYDEGTWYIISFFYYNLYEFKWSDGTSGGGYYTISNSIIEFAEKRAKFDCNLHTITFKGNNGELENGTYTINDNKLTIQFPNKVLVYERLKQ